MHSIDINSIFGILEKIDAFYWQYVGVSVLLIVGVYFTYRSRFYQFRSLMHLPKIISKVVQGARKDHPGVSPLRLIFAASGGMIGLGNVVAVVTALLIGGPGAIFWLWIAGFLGIIIKYAETFAGLRYRKLCPKGKGYDGGPMYFIPAAFKGRLGKILATVAALLLCIYGVEIYQFTVVTSTLSEVIGLSHEWVIGVCLCMTIYIGLGGVRRLASVTSWLMPMFIVGYSLICMYVILLNAPELPSVIWSIISSAFTGSGAMGGFVGSTMMLAAQQGAARAVYSADISVGFDSIVHSESQDSVAERHARVVMMATLIDVITCTMTLFVLMVTGVWKIHATGMENSQYVMMALQPYFPFDVKYLFACLVFLVGFTTVQAYFVVGLKCAYYLGKNIGRYLYVAYAIFAYWFFAHYDASKVMLIMSLSGGGLILINLISLFRLRDKINFHLEDDDSVAEDEELNKDKEPAVGSLKA